MRVRGSAACAIAAGVALLAGALPAGCRDVLFPANAQPASALPVYATWWHQVEACSGLTGDLGLVAWYTVPADSVGCFWCEDGPDESCAGEWVAPHAIYLAGPSRFFPQGYGADEWTVKHEMLHDLVGHAGHPRVFNVCGLASRTPAGWYGIGNH